MQAIKITATSRSNTGKNANRRLRAQGMIPAVAYGQGRPARGLAVSPEAVAHALSSERGRNVVVQLDVEGQAVDAMIAEYQYHPVSRSLLHADFIEVTEETVVEVEVPLTLTGKPKGVVMGGKLRQVFREVPVRCKPALIPVEIVHDVTELDLDQHVTAQDLQLPAGVSVVLRDKQTVAVVAIDKHKKEEEAEAAAAGATPAAAGATPAAAAAPAKAAPAKGGKAGK
jgi:large subunit ribosomal protein L25